MSAPTKIIPFAKPVESSVEAAPDNTAFPKLRREQHRYPQALPMAAVLGFAVPAHKDA